MIAHAHSHRGGGPGLLFAVFFCAILAAGIAVPRAAEAAQNLLINGDFAKGSQDQPDLWRTEAWINSPEAFHGHWHPSPNGDNALNELEVDNLHANDGRWMQSVTLAPGWYQLSVDIRTEDVGAKETGATISVMEDGIMSPDIHGTTPWQRVTLFLKVGGHGADVDVALRVGGFGSLNSGRAFFRNATLERIDALPPNATPTYDLQVVRQQAAPSPKGSPISLVLTFALLGTIAWVGWRIYGDDDFRVLNRLRTALSGRPRKR
jgi:dolichyl-phosphate-mannose-protein mannosyltransferase